MKGQEKYIGARPTVETWRLNNTPEQNKNEKYKHVNFEGIF
jgi:hypothetical protein